MATLASLTVAGFGLLISGSASSNLSAGEAAWAPVVALASAAPVATLSGPSSLAFTHWDGPGCPVSGYFSDSLYGHIHVLPDVLDLGNLLSVQNRTVEVWNARFDSQLLSGITAAGDDGVVFSGPPAPPTTFGPNESRFYAFSISELGGAALVATFQWQFAAEQPLLAITASRIVAVPWEPDWSEPPVELLSWKTDVLRSYTGKGQRRALRAKPRRHLALGYLLEDPHRCAQFQNMVWGWQEKTFGVPVWMDEGWTSEAIPQGSYEIPIDTTHKDYANDAAVMVWQDYLTWEVVEVLSFTTSLVTLKRPTQQAWPPLTRVIPMRVGRLPSSLQFERNTDTFAGTRIEWALDPAVGIGSNRCQDPGYPTYQGFDVLTEVTDWSEDVSESLTRDEDLVDAQVGPVPIVPRANAPEYTRPFHWTIKGRTAIGKFLGWLEDRKGRANPFWLPSYSQDLQQVEDLAASGIYLRVRETEYSLYLAQHTNRRDLAFIPLVGDAVFRRIIASERAAGVEVLTLDSSFGQIRKSSDWLRISYLLLVCLDQDSVEITWQSDDFIQASLSMTEVLL